MKYSIFLVLVWLLILAYCFAFWAFVWKYLPLIWGIFNNEAKAFVGCSVLSLLALCLLSFFSGSRVRRK